VFDRQHIMSHITNRDWNPGSRSVEILIGKLRKKLGENLSMPTLIKTVRNEGYKFCRSRDIHIITQNLWVIIVQP